MLGVMILSIAAQGFTASMIPSGLSTYYISINVLGGGTEEYLVDTGAGYMTITEKTFIRLADAGTVSYHKPLIATLADGTKVRVPVYELDEIEIGGCVVHDVLAAVLPGSTRGLLGMSVLARLAPFSFSTDPPTLSLNCEV